MAVNYRFITSLIFVSVLFSACSGGAGNNNFEPVDPNATNQELSDVVDPDPSGNNINPENTQPPAESDTSTQAVTTNIPPQADAGPDQFRNDSNGDNVEQVTLNGGNSTDPDNNIIDYVWKINDQQIATGSNPTVNLPVGTHFVTLQVTDSAGAKDSDTMRAVITEDQPAENIPQNQPPYVANPNNNQSVKAGDAFNYDATQGSTTFRDPDADPLNYTISLSPGNTGLNHQNGVISGTPGSAGTIVATITANDGQGGSVSDQFDITVTASSTTGSAEGKARFWQSVGSEFDQIISTADASRQQWISERYDRLLTFSTFFDKHTQWYKGGWEYENFYGVSPKIFSTLNKSEWILKDSNGNWLYIPFDCKNGACARYAMDFGNQEFRNWWINNMKNVMDRGDYRGMLIDDVNLTWRIGDGNGDHVLPIDPRTGTEMTLENWQKYMAEFLEQIKNNFPDKEKAFNLIWFAGETTNPYIQRQIDAADYVHLERGFMDYGLRGDGKWGLESFHAFIDFVHSRGKNFVASGEAETTSDRDYDLANYFLMTRGNDLLGEENNAWSMPDTWWSGYDTDLGAALGGRYIWNAAIRRDFENGIVLVNPPERQNLNLTLDRSYKRLNGNIVSSLTLQAKQGAVLTNN